MNLNVEPFSPFLNKLLTQFVQFYLLALISLQLFHIIEIFSRFQFGSVRIKVHEKD